MGLAQAESPSIRPASRANAWLRMGVSVAVDDGRLVGVETEEHAEDLLSGVKQGGDAGGLRSGLGSRIAPRHQPEHALRGRLAGLRPELRLLEVGVQRDLHIGEETAGQE